MRPRLLMTALAATLLLAGCFGGEEDSDEDAASTPAAGDAPVATATPTGEPTPTEAPAGSTPRPTPTFPPVATPQPVAAVPAYETVSLERPTEVISYPVGGYEIAIAEQAGEILGVREGQTTVLLDLSDRVSAAGNEEGLLSIQLDPQFSTNRHLWAYYSAAGPRRTVLARFTAAEDGTIDRATELVVLEQEQPFPNHNGGAIRFGPDRMLYLGLGDGGSSGDPEDHGQDLGTLLGSIIRIDVSRATAAEPYAIPADNPFVGESGARGEIYAYGLRNPYRISFDSATGELWVADVGQNRFEEVNRVQAGDNLGWNVMEGFACFEPSSGCDQSGLTLPVLDYPLDNGRCSVIGGVVARRAAATGVEGNYLFADHCSGQLWSVPSDAQQGVEPVLVAEDLGRVSSISQVGNQVYILVFGEPMWRLVDR